MGGNIPDGKFAGRKGVPVGSLIGGNFLDRNFPGGTFLEPFFLKVRLPPSKKICFICFNESPLKSWKMHFISSLKLFSFSRYLNFCPDFLVT